MTTKFSEFLEFCKNYLKDAKTKDIRKLIHKRYNDCSAAYLDSGGFFDLLCITRAKIESDPQHFFVHLKDFLNELKEHKHKRQACYGKRSLEDTSDSGSSPKVVWSEENSNQSTNAACFRDAYKQFLSQRVVIDESNVSSNSPEGNVSEGQASLGPQNGDEEDGHMSSDSQDREINVFDGHVSLNSQEGDENLSDSQTKASGDSFVRNNPPVATQQEKADPDSSILHSDASCELHTKVKSNNNESDNFMGIAIAEVKSLDSVDDVSTCTFSSGISNDSNNSPKSQLNASDIKYEIDKSITISKNDNCDGFLYSNKDNIKETEDPKSLMILESEEDEEHSKEKVFELTVDFISNKSDNEDVSLTPDKSSPQSQFNEDQNGKTLLGVESGHSESDSDRAGSLKVELLDEDFASIKTTGETDEDPAGDGTSSYDAYQNHDLKESVASDQARKKGSRRQIEYLEKLLKKLRDKIESIQSRELSFEDMDDEISDYILEDKYKKKFVKVWDKLCQLKERETTTGRPLEKKFIYEGTRYPEINTQIQKFINRKKVFPDFHDIKRLVIKTNTFFKLNLRTSALESLAREAFTDVGNQLQQRRIEDFRMTFGSSLTDQSRNSIDPALLDVDLQHKLEQNRSISKNRLDDVINKYAELQYYKEEEEEEEEEASSQTSSEKGEEEDDIHIEDFDLSNDQEKTSPEKKSPACPNESSLSSDEELPQFSGSTVSCHKKSSDGESHEKDNLSMKPYLCSISENSQEISSTEKQLVGKSSLSSRIEQTLSAVNKSLKKTVERLNPGTSKATTRGTVSIVINDDDDDGTIAARPILSSSRGIKRKNKICLSATEEKQAKLKRVEPKSISTDHDIQIESQIKIHSKIRFLEPTVKNEKLNWELGKEEMDVIQNYSAPDDVIILSDSD